MYDAIDLIEALGAEPALSQAGSISARAAAAGIPPDAASALIAGDVTTLARLLHARTEIVCAIATPEPETPQREDRPDQDPQPTPDEDKPDAPRPTG